MCSELKCGTGQIFVVDDEVLIQQTTKMILEECGYEVLLAGSGKEAVESFRENHKNIVCSILDLTLPDMSGMDVYEEMKVIQPDLKVVISSGRSDEAIVSNALEKGADRFLGKPFSVMDLADIVADLIR